MTTANKPPVCRFLITLIGIFFLAVIANLMSPAAALAASDS